MNIPKISSVSFGAKLSGRLMTKHKNSVKTPEEKATSKSSLDRLKNILPDYIIDTKPHNAGLVLVGKGAGYGNHYIELAKTYSRKDFKEDDISSEKLNKLVDTLESMYKDQDRISGSVIKITDPDILNNPQAISGISRLETEILPKMEKSEILKAPYQIEISSVKQEDSEAVKDLSSDEILNPDSTKISLKTIDKANNMVTYSAFFNTPDFLDEDNGADFWATLLTDKIAGLLINKYPEYIK